MVRRLWSRARRGRPPPVWVIPLVCFAAVFLAGKTFLATGWRTDAIPHDWDHMFSGIELARRAWLNGTPYFSWLPWVCGGLPTTDTFNFKPFSSETPLALLFGLLPGMKLNYLLWQSIGAWGTARLTRRLVPSATLTTAISAGIAFALHGFFLYHLRAGHLSYGYWGALPWIVDGIIRRRTLQTSFFMAYPVMALSIDFNAHTAFFGLLLGSILLASDRSSAGFLVRTAGLVAGMSAVVIGSLAPNVGEGYVVHKELPQSFASLFSFLTTPQLEIWACDVDCYWEYGAYVGYGITLLGASGILYALLARWRDVEHRVWTLGAVMAFLVALGPVAAFAPWNLLNHVPFFSNLQVNTRFLSELALFLIVGWALVVSNVRTAWLRLALTAASIGPVVAFAVASYELPCRGPELPNLAGREYDEPVRMERGNAKSASYPALVERIGITSCHTAWVADASKLAFRDGQGLLLEAPAGSRLAWDGARFLIHLDEAVPAASTWLLNQRYHPGLQALPTIGPPMPVSAESGLVKVSSAAPLPRGASISLEFRPSPSAQALLLITAASWCFFVSGVALAAIRRKGAPA